MDCVVIVSQGYFSLLVSTYFGFFFSSSVSMYVTKSSSSKNLPVLSLIHLCVRLKALKGALFSDLTSCKLGFVAFQALKHCKLELVHSCAKTTSLVGTCTCRWPLVSDLMLNPYDVILLSYKRADPFESACIDAQNFDLKPASSQVRSSVNRLNAVNED